MLKHLQRRVPLRLAKIQGARRVVQGIGDLRRRAPCPILCIALRPTPRISPIPWTTKRLHLIGKRSKQYHIQIWSFGPTLTV